MSGNKGKKPSRAEQLIAQAVREVEAEERGSTTPDAIDEALDKHYNDTRRVQNASAEEHVNRQTGPIAKIELQQVVDREAYLRLAAEFENFRKRAQKERGEIERSGRERILRGFLDILDNLERGVGQCQGDTSSIAEGMRMILSQAENWLRAEGLERISTQGQNFDPALHEAVSQREDSGSETGTILEEAKRGYRWGERLLRPASVVVCRNGYGTDKKEKP